MQTDLGRLFIVMGWILGICPNQQLAHSEYSGGAGYHRIGFAEYNPRIFRYAVR